MPPTETLYLESTNTVNTVAMQYVDADTPNIHV
jgi:hypothetical protein